MANFIPIEVKMTCVGMANAGYDTRDIYDNYFKLQFDNPQSYRSFKNGIYKWKKKTYPDETTLIAGTYEGFVAKGATVQVSKNGEIVQAWIKQTVADVDIDDFLKGVRESVEPYTYDPYKFNSSSNMLEIPLFDMHWGVAFFDYYRQTLDEILNLIEQHPWDKIVIPFGQDFFHNDSIVNGITTKGTQIEKVDMIRAVKEGREFMYAIIDHALQFANDIKVIYSPGNHDRSISWMFIQVLLERYGPDVVDDSLEYRKVITFGKNSIMFTHGDSSRATPTNLAHIFPISFPKEFADADIREVHSGHLHHELEADIYGVMVRRLSSGNKTDEWSNKEDFIGAHKRFMIFEWSPEKLVSIHYM